MLFFKKKKNEEKYLFDIRKVTLPDGTAYIGKNLIIDGTVSGSDNIITMGSINGEIELSGDIEIGDTSKINGKIYAEKIFVSGFVEGAVFASERICLEKTAKIKGVVIAKRLSVEDGAVFDGEARMSGNSESDNLFKDNENFNSCKKIRKNTSAEVIEEAKDFISNKTASFISRNSRVDGNVGGNESIIVEGFIKGLISLKGNIIVGSAGVIEADVEADNISVLGKITGNVFARQQLVIQPSGKIQGDISARSIDIKEGALFEGRSHMISSVSVP
ncbi:MAG: polymer-forming cytoskeletal protein [Proteobacteria bacterium]|nr:polymer-forming cytoskeletal protein [Pseudomonadota bacterium]